MSNTTLFQPMKIHLNHSFVGVQGLSETVELFSPCSRVLGCAWFCEHPFLAPSLHQRNPVEEKEVTSKEGKNNLEATGWMGFCGLQSLLQPRSHEVLIHGHSNLH